jgi:hypothetical protein
MEPTFDLDTGPEIQTNQPQDAFVMNLSGDPSHENIVLDRVEELGKIRVNSDPAT